MAPRCGRSHLRQHFLKGPQILGQNPRQLSFVRHLLQTALLVQPDHIGRNLELLRVGKDVPEHGVLHLAQRLGGAPGLMLRQHFPRTFQNFTVLYARRTGRFTGAAAQTQIERPLQLMKRQMSFRRHLHQIDPAARRMGLPFHGHIGRASRQTVAALDALDRFVVWQFFGMLHRPLPLR